MTKKQRKELEAFEQRCIDTEWRKIHCGLYPKRRRKSKHVRRENDHSREKGLIFRYRIVTQKH